MTFGNVELITVRARKYEDVNGNGVKDDGEPWLEGWEMTLNGADAQDTNADGWVVWDGLWPGDYEVCETDVAGWVNTAPGDGCRGPRTLESGGLWTAAFGNYRRLGVSAFKCEDMNADGVVSTKPVTRLVPGVPFVLPVRTDWATQLVRSMSRPMPTADSGSKAWPPATTS